MFAGNPLQFAAENVRLIRQHWRGVRDGDALDLSLDDSTSVAFVEPVFFRNSWPLAPAGGFSIDGMVAAQVSIQNMRVLRVIQTA